MHAPILESARLRLRPHAPSDLDAAAAMWADPAVTRYIGGRASTRHETWLRLLRYPGLWQWCGFGFWAVTDRASGAFLGEVGFADFRRDLTPPLGEVPEFGWALAASAHGRGLATEAARLALAWSDAHLAAPRVACIIDVANAPSMRVASKCGFGEPVEASLGGAPVLLQSRPRGGGG
jgi:RimJ/RimL family protein N-acetyltransferase